MNLRGPKKANVRDAAVGRALSPNEIVGRAVQSSPAHRRPDGIFSADPLKVLVFVLRQMLRRKRVVIEPFGACWEVKTSNPERSE